MSKPVCCGFFMELSVSDVWFCVHGGCNNTVSDKMWRLGQYQPKTWAPKVSHPLVKLDKELHALARRSA